MLTINFIKAFPSTQSITAEDQCSKALASIKSREKKKIHLHFAAIIMGTPAIIYKWTEQLSDRVSAKMTFAFSRV